MSDVNIAWDLGKSWTVHQIPSFLSPLFIGDRLVVFGLLKPSLGSNAGEAGAASKETHAHARLRGSFGNSAAIDHVIHFTATLAKNHDQAHHGTLHCLSAKCLIQGKQDDYHDSSRRWINDEKEAIKDSVIRTSKAANVISKFTSFVAIDKDNCQPVSRPMKPPMHMFFYEASDTLCTSCAIDTDSSDDDEELFYSNIDINCDLAEEKELLDYEDEEHFCVAPSPIPSPQVEKRKDTPPVLALITLQKASGSWDLTDQLVSLCGTSRDALIKGCPIEIAVDTGEGKVLWATAMALVLLMGKFSDQKDEWEMIAEKGSKWIKKNLPAGVKYENVLEAAANAVSVKIY